MRKFYRVYVETGQVLDEEPFLYYGDGRGDHLVVSVEDLKEYGNGGLPELDAEVSRYVGDDWHEGLGGA